MWLLRLAGTVNSWADNSPPEMNAITKLIRSSLKHICYSSDRSLIAFGPSTMQHVGPGRGLGIDDQHHGGANCDTDCPRLKAL